MTALKEDFDRLVQKCKNYYREKVEEFSVPLYHATTDKAGVCAEGLKPRCELEGKCGLGGGPDDTVSFTTNPKLAKDIALDLQTMVGIANGTLTFDNITEWLNKQDKKVGMTITPSKLWNKVIRGEYEPLDLSTINSAYINHIDRLLKGFRYEYCGFLCTEEDWKKKYPDRKMNYDTEWIKELEEDIPESVHKPDAYIEMTPKEEKSALFNLWRSNYLWTRGHKSVNGRSNPVIWGSERTLKGIEHLEKDDVAVVEVEGSTHEPLDKILDRLTRDPEYRNQILKEGWDYASGLEELRLNPRRFNKLQLREDICCD